MAAEQRREVQTALRDNEHLNEVEAPDDECDRPISMKRRLHELTSFLESRVDDGSMNEHVYVRACKQIKKMYEANASQEREIAERVVISYALATPYSLGGAPSEVNVFTDSFMKDLISSFLESTTDVDRRRDWIDEFLDFYLDPKMFERSYEDDDLARAFATLFIKEMPFAATQIMTHITKTVGVDSHDLFSFEDLYELVYTAPQITAFYFKDGKCTGEEFGWATRAEASILRFVCKNNINEFTDNAEFCDAVGINMHASDYCRREEKAADVSLVRAMIPDATRGCVTKYRRDGTVDAARMYNDVLNDMFAELSAECLVQNTVDDMLLELV